MKMNILGSAVNMGIIMMSGSIISPPDGADVTTTEGLKASMHLFQPKHFIFPFLAHALGTFAGAFLTGLLAVNHKLSNRQCFHFISTQLNISLHLF